MADVAVSTCSGDSASPKLLITARKVAEARSDLPSIAGLAKWCQNHISKAKVTHMEASVNDGFIFFFLNAQSEISRAPPTTFS